MLARRITYWIWSNFSCLFVCLYLCIWFSRIRYAEHEMPFMNFIYWNFSAHTLNGTGGGGTCVCSMSKRNANAARASSQPTRVRCHGTWGRAAFTVHFHSFRYWLYLSARLLNIYYSCLAGEAAARTVTVAAAAAAVDAAAWYLYVPEDRTIICHLIAALCAMCISVQYLCVKLI